MLWSKSTKRNFIKTIILYYFKISFYRTHTPSNLDTFQNLLSSPIFERRETSATAIQDPKTHFQLEKIILNTPTVFKSVFKLIWYSYYNSQLVVLRDIFQEIIWQQQYSNSWQDLLSFKEYKNYFLEMRTFSWLQTCVFPPAVSCRALLGSSEAEGRHWKNAANIFVAPIAIISWFGSIL